MGTTRTAPIVAALLGTLGLLFLMAREGQLKFAALYGIAAALVASWGWATLFVAQRTEPEPLQPFAESERAPGRRLFWFGVVAALLVLTLGIGLFGYGQLPWTISLSLLCLLPASVHRPGLLLFVIVSMMYLPLLGVYALWDPWETHYAEVAREILARNDWISLWWAQDHWFWSKPILIFWTEALSMSAMGVDYLPDANPTNPEWALRVPIYLMSMAALGAIYLTIKRLFNSRAGVLAAIVVATMPHFFFLAHQSITDMPLVAFVTIALCLLLLAIHCDEGERVPLYRLGPFRLSVQHLLLGAVVMVALPQALYLISLNVNLTEGWALTFQSDEFLFGSAGNADTPGNPAHQTQTPAVGGLIFQPFVQGIIWLVCLLYLCFSLRNERRTQRLYMYGFYFFCALAFMAKGLPGIAIPGLVALFYLIASNRWQLLGDGNFAIAPGALLVIVVSAPWYIAMFVRHGEAFTNRLLVHDHINRLASGVHGDTGGIQYYIQQLGYATFPWVALAPLALWLWLWPHKRDGHGRETLTFLGLWFFATFALFSGMVTKYHHYIFPAVVPLGMLIGIALDRLWGERHRREWLVMALSTAAMGFAVVTVAGAWGDIRGIIPETAMDAEDWAVTHPMSITIVLLALASTAWCLGNAGQLIQSQPKPLLGEQGRLMQSAVGAAIGVGAAILVFVGRDLSWVTAARPQGYERLVDLFVYNYKRPWPEHLDYRAMLTGFAVVGSVVFALAVSAAARPFMARLAVGLAICFCGWGLNVYLVDLSDHWGQQKLFKRYYAERSGPEEPIVAWQMNWKGENFYSGNRVNVFLQMSSSKMKKWLDDNKGKNVFFIFEHTRYSRFERLIENRHIKSLTTKRDCNKYLLVEVEL